MVVVVVKRILGCGWYLVGSVLHMASFEKLVSIILWFLETFCFGGIRSDLVAELTVLYSSLVNKEIHLLSKMHIFLFGTRNS